jgi:hypothetical protein
VNPGLVPENSAADLGEHGLEEALDEQPEPDRGHEQDQRGDRCRLRAAEVLGMQREREPVLSNATAGVPALAVPWFGLAGMMAVV